MRTAKKAANADFLTAADRRRLARLGIGVRSIRKQWRLLNDPPRYVNLLRPAVAGDGIRLFSAAERAAINNRFPSFFSGRGAVKFVPASGAASRLFSFLKQSAEESGNAEAERRAFVRGLRERRFAFSSDWLASHMGDFNRPKALIPFHRYGTEQRTALEEQLLETRALAERLGGACHLHLTVASEQEGLFQREAERLRAKYSWAGPSFFSFSEQSDATQTIALGPEGKPLRQADGELALRPSGHGALLANLAALEADLIFIKNIDNAMSERLFPETVTTFVALGGLLLELQRRVFVYLRRMTAGEYEKPFQNEVVDFLVQELSIPLPARFGEWRPVRKMDWARSRLHRPMRVCGVVPNRGEPGGGPFWAERESGEDSLQIVEAAEVDPLSPAQQNIFAAATHFNPVFMACAFKDFRGQMFDLERYADSGAGIISAKTWEGSPVKVLELPGLWNGGMADWTTLFVEVPAVVFAPVKTIIDLLRPEHQPEA